ncbi:MAG: tRNA lysidine(34) synthetase TilS [Candidatus Moranbacteria bacterium]|nr:tRNA lysidine(34) synthetase TilS [Candidatus Moranbacteria bacterium]
MSKNLIKKFQNISHQYDLWQKGSKIVLGVSGGPDSVAMFDIFAKLAPKYNLKLIIAHVNYGLRGKDSDLDQKLVEKYALRNELRLVVYKPVIKGKHSEEIFRNIRYNFFEKIRKDNNFDLVAVGHTLDDQAETYLMRIIRGSGLAGLASMKFKKGNIIRPLLGITKKEILEYLKGNKLNYRTDKTNKEIPFLRNKIRNELIPLLEKKYNPSIKETLYKSSLNIAEDYDLISQMAEGYYKKHRNLKISEILKLHPALQKRVILEAIKKEKKSLKDIEKTHLDEIIKVAKSNKSKSQIVLLKGLKITRIGDKLTINRLT